MDVRPRPDARDDAELALAATAGDRGAFRDNVIVYATMIS
jgi:hypothetical protein